MRKCATEVHLLNISQTHQKFQITFFFFGVGVKSYFVAALAAALVTGVSTVFLIVLPTGSMRL